MRDAERDVLAHMDFKPAIADNLKEMDARLFRDEPMGLDLDGAMVQPAASAC